MDHQPIDRRHPVRDLRGRAVHEPDVTLRQQAGQPSRVVDDDQRADAGTAHLCSGIGERRVGGDAVGIGDHAVLRALDDLDLADLRIDLAGTESAIDDPDAALLRLDDRHRRPGDGIHVGRNDGTLEADAPRQAAREIDRRGIAPRQHAVLRREDEVVERAAAHQIEHRAAGAFVDRRKSGRRISHWNYRSPGAAERDETCPCVRWKTC